MSVNALDADDTGNITGPFILSCEYCSWTSLDIGIQFDKPINLFAKLTKLRQEVVQQTSTTLTTAAEEEPEPSSIQSLDARFASLKTFYKSQLSKSGSATPVVPLTGDPRWDSPSNLERLMRLYTSVGIGKKATGKDSIMRESVEKAEGLHILDHASEQETIQKLHEQGWAGTASIAQQSEQKHITRFVDDLIPVPTLLRTKRSKRCRTCRHILVKPESKIQSTRFRIKLVAVNFVPSISIKPLQASSTASSPALDLQAIPAMKASQFLLTLKNPMFDSVKVTLATPSITPGRFGSKVTVLCPQFEIGANTDVWDEALGSGEGKGRSSKPRETKVKSAESEGKVAEAGKVWERGRNWTTVVVEVVCAAIEVQDDELEEDEDVLEIPVFVRIEYEADAAGDDGSGSAEKDKREKRELAYWCVLGVGKIARLQTS